MTSLTKSMHPPNELYDDDENRPLVPYILLLRVTKYQVVFRSNLSVFKNIPSKQINNIIVTDRDSDEIFWKSS